MAHNSPHNDPAYVAAQTGKVIGTQITTEALEKLAAQARRDTVTAAMGAVVVFEGVVRDHDGGQRVLNLTYTCHPTAEAQMAAVVAELSQKHPRTRIWAAHRIGELEIGEIAFLVVVAAAHRGDAFAACSETTDRIKAEVPIWKEQKLVDGASQWVGLE
ncbi:molybdenum cofactor biosynthesis protein MoaE [Corynebacterium caspium]|uniref:molybdenum cofactor biosynthesis protein MoaE n=1 Tax=Corynebacterium caspium TaxID=234828 RepID=UPI0003670574|nr:molybdenum cofactor biosynthesis protein MoaE [Corynebacterium caspium]WKD59471.1 Molybdopterin synthase catalytic subunit [Corynebacterium caspium DSM 44850]